jgi:hypothetical protein
MATEDSSEMAREMTEAVAATNVKVVAEGPAFYTNLAYKQAIEAQAGYTTINQAVITKAAETILSTSAAEGGADLASLGMLIKALMAQPVQATGS